MLRIIKNPDTTFYNKVKKALDNNSGYCPCHLERIPENKCMCKEFRDQVRRDEEGFCHCMLYKAVSDDKN